MISDPWNPNWQIDQSVKTRTLTQGQTDASRLAEAQTAASQSVRSETFYYILPYSVKPFSLIPIPTEGIQPGSVDVKLNWVTTLNTSTALSSLRAVRAQHAGWRTELLPV